METTKTLYHANGWATVVHAHNETLSCEKKEQAADLQDSSMKRGWISNAFSKWKQILKITLYDSVAMTLWKTQN